MSEDVNDGIKPNGHLQPCWLSHDCQLAQDQRQGNETLGLILTELKNMNGSLVGPATNSNRVSVWVFIFVVGLIGTWGILEHLENSKQSFSAGYGTGHIDVQPEKKTTGNEK